MVPILLDVVTTLTATTTLTIDGTDENIYLSTLGDLLTFLGGKWNYIGVAMMRGEPGQPSLFYHINPVTGA